MTLNCSLDTIIPPFRVLHTVQSEVTVFQDWNNAKWLLGDVGWFFVLTAHDIWLINGELVIQVEFMKRHQHPFPSNSQVSQEGRPLSQPRINLRASGDWIADEMQHFVLCLSCNEK